MHQIQSKDIVLEDSDVAKALIEYTTQCAIEHLVVGASAKGGFLRYIPSVSNSVSEAFEQTNGLID